MGKEYRKRETIIQSMKFKTNDRIRLHFSIENSPHTLLKSVSSISTLTGRDAYILFFGEEHWRRRQKRRRRWLHIGWGTIVSEVLKVKLCLIDCRWGALILEKESNTNGIWQDEGKIYLHSCVIGSPYWSSPARELFAFSCKCSRLVKNSSHASYVVSLLTCGGRPKSH